MLLDSRLALQKSYLPIKNLQPAMSWYLRKEQEGMEEGRKGRDGREGRRQERKKGRVT